MKEKQPTLFILAGPNGAGKSTYAKVYIPSEIEKINPDKINKSISEDNPELLYAESWEKTWKYIADRITDNIEKRKSFALESTLAGKTGFTRILEAKEKGFRVHITYIALDSLEMHFERVQNRVNRGGHNIPKEDIIRRFIASYRKLPQILTLADEATIFNNSDSTKSHVPILKVKEGLIVEMDKNIPSPVRESLKTTELRTGYNITPDESAVFDWKKAVREAKTVADIEFIFKGLNLI